MSLLTAPPTRVRVYAWRARAPGLAAEFATQKRPHMVRPARWKPHRLRSSREVFRHLRAGQSLRHGVEGGGGRKRAGKLSWSLAEALRERDTKFAMHRTHCL